MRALAALSSVISAYKETSEMVEREPAAYDSGQSHLNEEPEMHAVVTSQAPFRQVAPPADTAGKINESERQISLYDFEDGQYVRIVATKGISTEEALDMAETMIELKRKELARKKPRTIAASSGFDADSENDAE